MKTVKYLFLAFIAALSLSIASCSDNDPVSASDDPRILGQWRYSEVQFDLSVANPSIEAEIIADNESSYGNINSPLAFFTMWGIYYTHRIGQETKKQCEYNVKNGLFYFRANNEVYQFPYLLSESGETLTFIIDKTEEYADKYGRQYIMYVKVHVKYHKETTI